MSNGRWFECCVDSDYEINDEYPHFIRRIGTTRNIALTVRQNSYVQVKLNGKTYAHHRLVALQFVKNDDPDNKVEVDHIDRVRTNNNKSNLRWVSKTQNNRNRGITKDAEQEYFDELPDDTISITKYGRHILENHYYSPIADMFYFHDQELNHYRKLYISNHEGHMVVQPRNVDGKQFILYVKKFKRDNGYI